jgi:hypothetical protein
MCFIAVQANAQLWIWINWLVFHLLGSEDLLVRSALNACDVTGVWESA